MVSNPSPAMSQAMLPYSLLAKVTATASEPSTWTNQRCAVRSRDRCPPIRAHLGHGERGVEGDDGEEVDEHHHGAGDGDGAGQVPHRVLHNQ